MAQTDATVLVRGESGTGKELVARTIYEHSARSDKRLLIVNCAAIPESLLESELFGCERGAFTGAVARRIGKFEQAHGGTILLDEIGDMPLSIQAKILRVLQDQTFDRLGGNNEVHVNVRILAATNRNLEKAIAEGKFREDLYHRLKVVTIRIPSLRERRVDIPKLTDYLLGRSAAALGFEKPIVSEEALDVLRAHSWPGNVRELAHCLERCVIFSRRFPIQADDVRHALETSRNLRPPDEPLPEAVRLLGLVQEFLRSHSGVRPHQDFLALVDQALLLEALQRTGGNRTEAAKLLGLSRPTLQDKLKKYGIAHHADDRDE